MVCPDLAFMEVRLTGRSREAAMAYAGVPDGNRAGVRVADRFRLDDRAGELSGAALWQGTDELLRRPVAVYALPPGPPATGLPAAVRAAARVTDPRLARIFDADFGARCPYIVAEWAPGEHVEDLLLTGPPSPALSAADTAGLARILYAWLTGYWPGEAATGLPPAPRHGGRFCAPRQVQAGIPGILSAITCRALQPGPSGTGLATPVQLALELRSSARVTTWPAPLASGAIPRPRQPGARSGARHAAALAGQLAGGARGLALRAMTQPER
jgi:hypothetical protein